MAIEGATRQDTWAISITVAGRPCGIWDKKGGGELDSEEYKYSPGAMADPVSLGGRKTIGNLTVSRNYRLARDHRDLVSFLFGQVGKGRVVASIQPLDHDGIAQSDYKPIVYKGTLKRVTPPDVDSESSTAAMIELEITTDSPPHIG